MNPADFASVVAKNWSKTTGYIVTDQEPCLTIGRDEVRNVGRRLALVRLADVPRLEPGPSWFMGVLVCAGDDLAWLASWARGRDANRVHFYLHVSARPRQLAPWRDAGLPLGHVDDGIRTWQALHKMLGWDLNVQVYDDHAPARRP